MRLRNCCLHEHPPVPEDGRRIRERGSGFGETRRDVAVARHDALVGVDDTRGGVRHHQVIAEAAAASRAAAAAAAAVVVYAVAVVVARVVVPNGLRCVVMAAGVSVGVVVVVVSVGVADAGGILATCRIQHSSERKHVVVVAAST